MHGTHSALPLVHGRLRFHRVNTGGGVERERHSVNRGGQGQKSAAGLGGEKDRNEKRHARGDRPVAIGTVGVVVAQRRQGACMRTQSHCGAWNSLRRA